MKKIIVLFSIASVLFRCTGEKEAFVADEVVRLELKDMPQLDYVTPEKVEVPDTIIDSNIFVYNDSVSIVVNYSGKFSYHICILKKGRLVAKYFRHGEGPNEMLSCTAFLNGEYLCVKDLMLHRIGKIYIDSIGNVGYAPTLVSENPRQMSRGYNWYGDTIILSNGYYFEGYGIPETEPEFLKLNNRGELSTLEHGDRKLFVANISGGPILTNEKKGVVFYAKSKRPYFCYMDKLLHKKKLYMGPEPDETSYVIEDGEVNYREGQNFYVKIDGTCTSKYIFVVNCREHNIKKWTYQKEIEQEEVWQFDWDGNFIKRYKIPRLIYSLSFVESSNTLYVNALDDDNELTLYRCVLDF